MNIEALENELVAVLKARTTQTLPNVDIITIPENNADFKKGYSALIVVGYMSSNYDKPTTMLAVAQDEELTVSIAIESRVLRGNLGIWDIKQKVLNALLGYRPASCTKPIRAKYFGPPKDDATPVLVDGLWVFELHVCTDTVAVQGQDIVDPNAIDNLQNVTFDTTVGQDDYIFNNNNFQP